MCAIIDADVVSEAFGPEVTSAGRFFKDAVDSGSIQLVVGGELLDELDRNHNFSMWRAVARSTGRVQVISGEDVKARELKLRSSNSCQSNDAHVIALAQESGARLLFSNDKSLHLDFKSKHLLDNPRGKVFTTNEAKEVSKAHRRLVGERSLCRSRK